MIVKGQLKRSGAVGDETDLAWRGRARFHRKVAAVFFGIALFGAFLLSHMGPWGRRAGREMSCSVRLGEWLGPVGCFVIWAA